MKVAILAIIFAIVITLSPAAHAQGNREAFYDAFKTFCADTGARPDSVRAAVEAAPFATPIQPPASTTNPYPMTAAGWNVNWNGHPFTVNTGTSQAPHGPKLVMGTVSCVISSRTNEDAGIAAIREWVGVQSDPGSSSSSGVKYYSYREDGSGRTTIIGDDAAFKSSKNEGKAWLLTVIQKADFASVQLMHFLMPTPRNSN
jgi:hypothetical protein